MTLNEWIYRVRHYNDWCATHGFYGFPFNREDMELVIRNWSERSFWYERFFNDFVANCRDRYPVPYYSPRRWPSLQDVDFLRQNTVRYYARE